MIRGFQAGMASEIDGLIGRVLHRVSGRQTVRTPKAAADEPEWPGSGEAALNEQDREAVARVEEYLSRGMALYRWWKRAEATKTFAVRFDLGRTFNDPSESYGFFDVAPVGGRDMPVMGNFQEMFYDQDRGPSTPADMTSWLRRQVREFVLQYFMRVSDFREPDAYITNAPPPSATWSNPFSWCPREDIRRRGFGFEQLYYKHARSGAVGKFADAARHAIIDLREIGSEYEWIVVKVSIFNFNFTVRPFGPGTPSLSVPLHEESLLVLSRDFIVDSAQNGSAMYGLGYAFMKNPAESITAYGPGEFDAAIELMEFAVASDCSIRVRMVFVANRPVRVVNFSLDPTVWTARALRLAFGESFASWSTESTGRLTFDPVYAYIALANTLTAGLASDRWCISRDQLDRDFLVQHFMQHYQAIVGSLATWRRVPDWCDAAALPSWISTGISS